VDHFFRVMVCITAIVGSACGARAQYSGSSLWQGAYVGAHVGTSWGEFSDLADLARHNVRELGGHAGYNWQFGQLVFGIEGDVGGAQGHGRFANDFGRFQRTLETTTPFVGSVRTRLGLSTGNALAFISGGVAFSRASLEIHDMGTARITTPGPRGRPIVTIVPFSSTKIFEDNITGFVVSGGIDYRFSPSISGRIEGLQYGFNNVWGEGNSLSATAVRVGIAYHFN
jgi:outer membrane immunogenic protein